MLLKNLKLVNVLSGEIESNVEILIKGDKIAEVGTGLSDDEVIDLGGRYVYPALIDAHIHLESTKLTVGEAARVMARFGTGAVVTDPHEIANVSGLDGLRYQRECAADNGRIHVFFTAPSCVPALKDAAIETFGNDLGPAELRTLLNDDNVVALGEMMNVPGVIFKNDEVLQKIADFKAAGRVIDGHAPMVGGSTLNTCIAAGISSDHESTSLDEAREKLRRGMDLMIREGSSERNLDALLPLVNEFNASHFMFASDDLDPSDMMARGHINHLVARAVKAGMSPIRALQIATINAARHFKVDDRVGAIRPGANANLVVADDLTEFMPVHVLHDGRFVVRDGAEIPVKPSAPHTLAPAMHVVLPDKAALAVPAKAGQARAMGIVPGQILTTVERFDPVVKDGNVVPSGDFAKVCVFERHKNSGSFGVTFVKGFGIQRGAIGSSVGHDSHNIVVVGMNDDDIMRCAAIIRDMNGGQAAVLGEQTATLPLPVAGLMSDQTAENVVKAEKQLDQFAADTLGVTLARPMAALSFMSLPVIPNLRITDKGMFYVAPGAYPVRIDLFD